MPAQTNQQKNGRSLRALVVLLIAAIALSAGGFFALRSWHAQKEAAWGRITDPQRRREITSIRQRLAKLDFSASITEPEAIRAVLQGAELQGNAPGDPRVEAAIDLATEFLHRRFADPDAQAYIKWRKDLGYVEEDWEWLERAWTISLGWPIFTGTPFPEELSTEDIFAGLFVPVIEYNDGANRPIRLATSPGAAIRIDTLTEYSKARPNLHGEIEEAIWYKGPVGTRCP